jgi:predicted RNA-binding Zn ribbon-like protein
MDRVETPAAQRLVGGLLLPLPVAGHPALELCNTIAGWADAEPHDYLASYLHVVALAHSLRLVRPGQARALTAASTGDPLEASRVLGDVRRLREDLYATLTRSGDAALVRLNTTLTQAAAARRIEAIGHGGDPLWGFGEPGLGLPLLVLAWQAHRLLDGADGVAPSRVRACPGAGCGWLFTDPRGQRRWCVMSLCGNRAKARRHAQRSRRDAGRGDHAERGTSTAR